MSRIFKNYADKLRMSSGSSCKFGQGLVFSDFLTFVVMLGLGTSFRQLLTAKQAAADKVKQLSATKETAKLSEFQKIELSGEDTSGVDITDIGHSAKELVKALKLRMQYMSSSHQSVSHIISWLLECLDKNTNVEWTTDKINDDYQRFKAEHTQVDEFKITTNSGMCTRMTEGVVFVYSDESALAIGDHVTIPHIDRKQFIEDQKTMYDLISDGPLRSYCDTRLCYLSTKFNMHILMNNLKETAAQKILSHRDFYNIIKVDTHVHASGCMNQNDLLKFIKNKLEKEGHTKVSRNTTLNQVCERIALKSGELNLDKLDVHADRHTFNRFDKFNKKYNPVGESILRRIFLKTDNHMKGRYFAEILEEVIANLNQNGYQKAEYRLSIYGRRLDEWKKLAVWAKHFYNRWDNFSMDNVKWMIQVPRLYDVYRSQNKKLKFEDILNNLFQPLFEATINPRKNPDLSVFLQHVSGIDSVDDESKSEHTPFTCKTYPPDTWKEEENPNYTYYLYYIYVNLAVLNKIRSKLNLNTFVFRPHCGEAGNVTHLVAGFLFAENISHGLMLRQSPALEYLYYLSQIGIAMSPMSNNALFLKYQFNPLPEYFNRGLNVSLSTDDPMQFHFTKDPLLEEYSIAAQIWNLSSCDMCEIAKNSVLQSGFDTMKKKEWVAEHYTKAGLEGNDVKKTNVPSIRTEYRYDTLVHELLLILMGVQLPDESKEP